MTNTAKPRFHITGLSGGAHDINAIFKWKGKIHVMNQRDNNWGHLVSSDFITWTRLPDALIGGSWDGSLSIVNGTPLILYDCTTIANCRPPAGSGMEVTGTERSGDPPIVGVARPADMTDPLLMHWQKDVANPAIFPGPHTYSGPSNIWKNSVTGKLQMEMILGTTTGLWETSDPNLHQWTLVNASFYPTRAGGGGIFLPLPRTSSSVPTTAGNYTHMLNEGSNCQDFVLGSFDPASSTFIPAPSTQKRVAIDWGDVMFSEVNVIDGRMLHMGWVSRADCLTIPREITYDAAIAQLQSNPITEVASLRSKKALGPPTTMPLQLHEGQSFGIFEKQGTTAIDIELNLTVGSVPFAVSVAFLSSEPPKAVGCDGNLYCIALNVTRDLRSNVPKPDYLVTVVSSGGKTKTSFVLPHSVPELAVRALVDRSILEVFVGNGRVAITNNVGMPPSSARGAYVTAHTAAKVAGASAWEMACGWADAAMSPGNIALPKSPMEEPKEPLFTVTHGVCPYSVKSWKEYKGKSDSLSQCESACIAANCSLFTWNHAVKPKQCWGYSGPHPSWSMKPNPHCDSGCLKSRVSNCGTPAPPPPPPPSPPGPLPPDFPRYVGPRPKVSINASAGARLNYVHYCIWFFRRVQGRSADV